MASMQTLMESFRISMLSEEKERSWPDVAGLGLKVARGKMGVRLMIYDRSGMQGTITIDKLNLGPEEMVYHGERGFEEEKTGNCFDAWHVLNSDLDEAYQGKGYGKLLYALAMTHIYPEGLTADRFGDNSDQAQNVWRSLAADPRFEPTIPKSGGYMGKFDNVSDPKTPPKEDDCILKYTNGRENVALNIPYASNSAKAEYDAMLENYRQMRIERRKKKKAASAPKPKKRAERKAVNPQEFAAQLKQRNVSAKVKLKAMKGKFPHLSMGQIKELL